MPKVTNYDKSILLRVNEDKHAKIKALAEQINEDASEFYRKAADERYQKLLKKLNK